MLLQWVAMRLEQGKLHGNDTVIDVKMAINPSPLYIHPF